MTQPRVVVVGGGFGGLEVARRLAGAPCELVLIDKRNFHLFQPLLYQVAGAALAPGDISEPIRGLLAGQANAQVMLGEVTAVDLARRALHIEGVGDRRSLTYDHLVLAAGLRSSWFGHDAQWAPFAPGLKDLDDALEIRRRVLLAFEEAEWTDDPRVRQALLTFVVVGGGPTGVELAGALNEIACKSLPKDFHRIDTRTARVLLVEAGPDLLPPYDARLRASARAQLAALGVQVRTGTKVVAIDGDGVDLLTDSGTERVASRTVLWAAGLRAVSLVDSLDVPKDRVGRVEVLPDLSVPGHPEVFVIGDLALARQPTGGVVPGVAQGAVQGGRHVARILIKALRAPDGSTETEGSRPAFVYKDKGSMATIGRSMAVAEIGRARLSGRVAWSLWLTIHLFFLIGFRNRVVVLMQWAWSYLTWERNSRLIRGRERRRDPGAAP